MRIVRVQNGDQPSYGVLEDDVIHLLAGDALAGELDGRTGQTLPLQGTPLLTPVRPGKILAIGRNYAAHAQEMGMELGGNPSVFMKPLETLVAHDGTVVLPPEDVSDHVEHEAELAVVIGRPARNVARADAAAYVLGFTCADDVSARDVQKADPQITRGKGFDTFCPLGPWVETNVSLDTEHEIVCTVNGEERQRATTAQLIFPIDVLVAWLSAWTTLMPGDVILTGSPGGTSKLSDGDTVEVTVSGVGTLRHGVAGSR